MTDHRETVILRLVARSTEDTSIVLDAVAHHPDDEVGSPVAIVLGRPETAWFDAFVVDLLDEWATRSEAVQFRVKRGRRGQTAVLVERSGPTRLQLDLLDVA